jgi:hypothetical protein
MIVNIVDVFHFAMVIIEIGLVFFEPNSVFCNISEETLLSTADLQCRDTSNP